MENKKISCSYALLVIILFAALAFVTDYAYIQDKIRTCSCPKCDSGSVVTDNSNISTGEKVYSYDDLAGYYTGSVNFDNPVTEDKYAKYHLFLYNDGTFVYTYSYAVPIGFIGNYLINGNKIVLNGLFNISTDVSLYISNETKTLIINDNNSIVDSNAPFSDITGTKEISLVREQSDLENQFKDHIKTGIIVND